MSLIKTLVFFFPPKTFDGQDFLGFGTLDKGLYTFIKKEGEGKSPVTPPLRNNILLSSLPSFVCIYVCIRTYI